MKSVQLISRNLRQIDHLYNKKVARELSEIKVDHHFEMLLILAKQTSPRTQNELAEMLHIDKSRMANIIFYLEEKGLVTIKINPADRRQHYVSLSPDGLNRIPYIEHKINQINSQARLGITDEKLNIFFEVSEAMRQNLSEKGSTGK